MKEYQLKKDNPYWLPHSVYMQALWIIRDYDRIVYEADSIITDSPSYDCGLDKSKISDPVFGKVLRRSVLAERAKKIKECLNVIPEEYRSGVWSSIVYRTRYPDDANKRTYGRYRAQFIHRVAKVFVLI